MSIHDKRYVLLTVIAWDSELKIGKIRDQQGSVYDVKLKHLTPECDGCLFVGETVEGVVTDWNIVQEIIGTAAPDERKRRTTHHDGLRERSNFKSRGQ